MSHFLNLMARNKAGNEGNDFVHEAGQSRVVLSKRRFLIDGNFVKLSELEVLISISILSTKKPTLTMSIGFYYSFNQLISESPEGWLLYCQSSNAIGKLQQKQRSNRKPCCLLLSWLIR